MNEIDYEILKKRGFLPQKQEGFFLLRTRSRAGNYTAGQLAALIGISEKYGRGILHATTRQGFEIPFIKYEDIERVEKEIETAGIYTGASGPRVRAVTCCPGVSWCRRALVDTAEIFNKIEKELNIRCGMELPHKLKIAISGCPNKCTRAETSDIGIHGAVDASGPDRKIGYAIYLGGSGGTRPRSALKLDKVFTLDEALHIVEKVIMFYKKNARPKQRLGLLIEESGKENFINTVIAFSA